MKLCAKFSVLLIVAVMLSAIAPVFALDPAVRKAGLANQAMTFDKVEKISSVTLSSTVVITPTDIVSTNTASVYYLPDNVKYPIELEIQNTSAASITYNIYSTAVGTGVDVPDATDPAVFDVTGALNVSNKITKMVFYQAPNISFGSAGSAIAKFTVRSIKEEE